MKTTATSIGKMLIVLLITFQISGLLYLTLVVADDETTNSTATAGQSSSDQKYNCSDPADCPPGCPTCHGQSHSAMDAPSTVIGSSAVRLGIPPAMTLDPTSHIPTSPDLPSLFRPPRA